MHIRKPENEVLHLGSSEKKSEKDLNKIKARIAEGK